MGADAGILSAVQKGGSSAFEAAMAGRGECHRLASLPLRMKFYRGGESSHGNEMSQAEDQGWKVRLVWLQQLKSTDEGEVVVKEVAKQASTSSSIAISEARLKQFMALLLRCIDERNRAESLDLHVVRAFFAKAEKKSPFSEAEIDACIEKMSNDNKLMRSEDTIYVI